MRYHIMFRARMDLNIFNLKLQLEILSNNIPSNIEDIFGIKVYLQHLSSAERELISEVVVLILVMPATNSTSKRSFRAYQNIP